MEVDEMPTLQSLIDAGYVPQSITGTGDVRIDTSSPERWYYCAEQKAPLHPNLDTLDNGGMTHTCPGEKCKTQVTVPPIPDWGNAHK